MTDLRPLGAWVAIEQVEAMMLAGGALYRPHTARAPEAFVGLVLALGAGVPDDAPFEPGDFVVVEKMSGHPHMAGESRPIYRGGRKMPGKSVVLDLRASSFGGSPDKPVGLVRYDSTTRRPCLLDEQAARRMRRGAAIYQAEHDKKKHLDDDATRHLMAEAQRHERWARQYEASRVGRRRSRLMKPSADPALGEGIIAVIRDAEQLLSFGVDPAWLAEHLEVEPAC